MKSALALFALALLAAACAPGAPSGPAGKWQGERLKAPEEPESSPGKEGPGPDGTGKEGAGSPGSGETGAGQKGQDGPSISTGLTEALGGDSLELKPDGSFILMMAGAEIGGDWKQEKGFILLRPQAVMGRGPDEAPEELKEFFEPVSLGESADGSELTLIESGPWPGLRFRRPKS